MSPVPLSHSPSGLETVKSVSSGLVHSMLCAAALCTALSTSGDAVAQKPPAVAPAGAEGGGASPDSDDEPLVPPIDLEKTPKAESLTPEQIIRNLQNELNNDPKNAKKWMQLGFFQGNEGQHEEAIKSFTEAIRCGDDDLKKSALLLRGLTYFSTNKIPEALKDLTTLCNADPTNTQAHYWRSFSLMRAGKYAEAVAGFSTVLKLDPSNMEALKKRAECLRSGDNPNMTAAVSDYKSLHEKQPDNVQAHGNYADTLLDAGRYKEAVTVYTQLIERIPNNAHARFHRGLAYKGMRTMQQAWEEFREAEQRAGNNAGLLHKIGEQYVNTEAYDDAIRLYENLLKKGDHPIVRYNLAQVLRLSGKPQESIEHYSAFTKSAPKDPKGFAMRGRAYTDVREHQKAASDFKTAYELEPEDLQHLSSLSTALMMAAEYEEAADNLTELEEKLTKLQVSIGADLYYVRSTAYNALGYYEKEVQDLQMALTKPQSSARHSAAMDLALRLVQDNRAEFYNPKEALAIAEQLVPRIASDAPQPSLIVTLDHRALSIQAIVYAANGKWEEANKAINDALRVTDKDSRLLKDYEHLRDLFKHKQPLEQPLLPRVPDDRQAMHNHLPHTSMTVGHHGIDGQKKSRTALHAAEVDSQDLSTTVATTA